MNDIQTPNAPDPIAGDPRTDDVGTTDPDAHQVVDVVTMILAAIADVAPELESELPDLDHDVDLWTELQLDSMDHLAVMTRLSEQTGHEIPERDYPRLTTVETLRSYLSLAVPTSGDDG